jgi:hypothetical protein
MWTLSLKNKSTIASCHTKLGTAKMQKGKKDKHGWKREQNGEQYEKNILATLSKHVLACKIRANKIHKDMHHKLK